METITTFIITHDHKLVLVFITMVLLLILPPLVSKYRHTLIVQLLKVDLAFLVILGLILVPLLIGLGAIFAIAYAIVHVVF